MSAPRVYFAMARDGLFIPEQRRSIKDLVPGARYRPACLARFATCGAGELQSIVSYFIFVVVIFVALTVSVVFVVRRKHPDKNAYQTPGYPITPIVFLLLVAVLLFLLASNSPKQSFLGLGVVALGVPVYYLLFARRIVESNDKEN